MSRVPSFDKFAYTSDKEMGVHHNRWQALACNLNEFTARLNEDRRLRTCSDTLRDQGVEATLDGMTGQGGEADEGLFHFIMFYCSNTADSPIEIGN